MGFERLCVAMQGKESNYDTDVFTPLISEISSLSGKEYGKDAKVDVAMRVVADHVENHSILNSRLTVAVQCQGRLRNPSHPPARSKICLYLPRCQRGFRTYRLTDCLVAQMGDAYPELSAQKELIKRVIKEEEDSFLRTLDNGIRLLDNVMAQASKRRQNDC